MGFGPLGLDLGLEARIWASRLGYEPQGYDMSFKGGGMEGEKEKEKKEKEKGKKKEKKEKKKK